MICRHALVRLRYTHHARRHISTTVRLCNRHEPLDTANHSATPDISQPITDTIPDHAISETVSEAVVFTQPISDPLTEHLTSDTLAGDAVTVIAGEAVEDTMVSTAVDYFSSTVGTTVEYLVWPLKKLLTLVGFNFWEASDKLDLVSPFLDHAPAKLSNLYAPWILDHFQDLTGTPWIFLCLGTTVLIRAALWKLTVKNLVGYRNLPQELSQFVIIQKNLEYFTETKQMEKVQMAQKAMKDNKTRKIMMWLGLNGFLMTVPIRGTFNSLKSLEGLTVNEYGWIPDLTAADPYYILPSIVVTNLVIVGLVNFRHHKYFNERSGTLGVLGAGTMVYLMSGMSAVMCQHFALSSTITMLIHVARENEVLRIKLGLPPTAAPEAPSVAKEPVYETRHGKAIHARKPAERKKGMFENMKQKADSSSMMKGLNPENGGTIKRIKSWFFMWKLKRHGAKGITTEFLDEKPPMPRFGSDSVVLVTEVTPELKKYVLRRQHDRKTYKGMQETVEYMKRVQNQRW